MTSDEAPLRGGEGKNSAPLALLQQPALRPVLNLIQDLFQGRLLLPVLALGGLLLLSGCGTTPPVNDMGEVDDYAAIEKEGRAEVHLAPDNGWGHVLLGYALWKQRKYQEAEKEYREVVRLLPDEPVGYGRLGVILANQGKFEEGEKEALRGTRLKPDGFGYAHYYLSCCYSLWGKKEEAIKSLQKAYEKGFLYWPGMTNDIELRGIKKDSRFKVLAERVKARWERFPKGRGGI